MNKNDLLTRISNLDLETSDNDVIAKISNELPILHNLLECFGQKVIEIDNYIHEMKTEINNIKMCLDVLIKKWY